MKKMTVYVAENKTWPGAKKFQTAAIPYHESEEEAKKAAEASAREFMTSITPEYGRDFRVRAVKAIKLEAGDKIEGRSLTGRFSDIRDEWQTTGSRAFSGVVSEDSETGMDKSCGLRIGNKSLAHPYIINGRGAGLENVKATA